MLKFSSMFKVIEISDEVFTLNDSDYIKGVVQVNNNINLKCLLNKTLVEGIEEGGIYTSDKCTLTCFGEYGSRNAANMCMRVDRIVDTATPEEFKDYSTHVAVSGLLRKKHIHKYKERGPERTPLCTAMLTVRNENKEIFSLNICGYHKAAKLLRDVEDQCYVDIVGVLFHKSEKLSPIIIIKDITVR